MTLAYEALSRGIKVLFFSLRTNEIPSNGELFGWPYKKIKWRILDNKIRCPGD